MAVACETPRWDRVLAERTRGAAFQYTPTQGSAGIERLASLVKH